ncbi:hypothetical protein BDV38DRAFT_244826 [Aspergillus pseudotamarii]|uniref:Uncharacterized protein n=1 Tax=Aspergillus pseudotamarii TaxID=132259 RepID=A0A5N6SXT1_ASPPS|nr:uncharacterized protein BDV38DRAFT_244826 [Aspergillus pseudotamarii]KAE8138193.1 hypothetical protein BDV38DRAFT_244826 [Aspergillus pseudotamarii]
MMLFEQRKKKALELAEQTNDALKTIQEVGQKLNITSDTVKKVIETIKIAANSFGDKAAYASAFTGTVGAVGIAANMIATYQGVGELRAIAGHLKSMSETQRAELALAGGTAFAENIYVMLKSKIEKSDPELDWFFVYHPDTDWTYHFEEKLRTKGLLGRNFIGIVHDLDALVAFMSSVRDVYATRHPRRRPPFFHLVIPAYEPIIIPTPLLIPEKLHPFRIEGDIHRGTYLVWMNLPGVDEKAVQNIGVFQPPRSIWDNIMLQVGLVQNPPPRFLGASAQTIEQPQVPQLPEPTPVAAITAPEPEKGEISSLKASRGSIRRAQTYQDSEAGSTHSSRSHTHRRRRRHRSNSVSYIFT